ncbi:MAG: hypothetical protein AB1631_32310 [Acidobacteriota bacterium]
MRLNRYFAMFLIASLSALALLLTGATPGSVAAAPRAGTYVGQLEGLIDLIGIDVRQADKNNRRIVRAYLCDGEPGGDARWYSGVMVGNKVHLVSTDGETTLEVKLGHDAATGFVIFADGSVRRFTAPPARWGGGIYEIEVTADGIARGVSLAGDTFIATKSSERISNIGDGRPWEVTVTTARGKTFQYIYYDFTTFSVEELERYGLPTSYATTGVVGIQPDLYTVVWQGAVYAFGPGWGGFLFGRSGDVKRGVPSTNIWPGGACPAGM